MKMAIKIKLQSKKLINFLNSFLFDKIFFKIMKKYINII